MALVLSAGLNNISRTFLFHEHKGRLSTLDWESVASPNGRVQIFQALAHKSGKKGAGDRQMSRFSFRDTVKSFVIQELLGLEC